MQRRTEIGTVTVPVPNHPERSWERSYRSSGRVGLLGLSSSHEVTAANSRSTTFEGRPNNCRDPLRAENPETSTDASNPRGPDDAVRKPGKGGDWLLTSDADVMIVSPDFGGRRFVDRSAEVLRNWRGRVVPEVFCYTPDEIADHWWAVGFVAQALKEGRRI
jgi:hypothetical protein